MSEEKIVIEGDVEAGEESRVRLSGPCEINEFPITTYEIEIPQIVLNELGILFYKEEKIQFIKENGRIYVEKAKE